MKDSVVIFRNQLEAIMALNNLRDVKIVVKALIDYGMNGKVIDDMPEHLQFGWTLIKSQIDRVNSHYQEVSEKRRESVKKRWSQKNAKDSKSTKDTNVSDVYNGIQNSTTAYYNDNDNDNDISPSNEGEIKNAHPCARVHSLSENYPVSADEVIRIANNACIKINPQQAQFYLDYRVSRGWIPNGASKPVKVSAIPSDLKVWLSREKQTQTKKGNDYASGKNMPTEYNDHDEF